MQQNISKYYRFELADVWCEQFNKFVNTLKKEKRGNERGISMVRSQQWKKVHVR